MHQIWDLVGKSRSWTIPSPVVRPFRPRAITKPVPRSQPPQGERAPARCRICDGVLSPPILELRSLRIAQCSACHLVQLADTSLDPPPRQACGRDYARHEVESLIRGLRLGEQALVIEIASGRGDRLRMFQECGIGVLGMEEDRTCVRAASDGGIPMRACALNDFTARRLTQDGVAADLLIAHDAVARTARLGSLLAAARRVLKPNGVLLIETPHLLTIFQETRFHSFRAEHAAYFSLIALERAMSAHGLRVVHASPARDPRLLRVYACRVESTLVQSDTVAKMLGREREAGLDRDATCVEFGDRARAGVERLRTFIRDIRNEGKTIVAFGASHEGDALLGCCDIGADTIAYVADPDAAKHGTTLPGTGIPVAAPERIRSSRPDFLLVLPGCPVQDVVRRHAYIQGWGGRFGCLALR